LIIYGSFFEDCSTSGTRTSAVGGKSRFLTKKVLLGKSGLVTTSWGTLRLTSSDVHVT
jgi:hypothetical protein